MRFFSTVFLPALVVALALSSCFNVDSDPAVTFEQQFINDTTAIGNYLRTKNLNAIKDLSGIRVVIDSLGSGFPPKNSSTVKVSYTGRLLSEQIFDQGTNITFDLANLIPGFQIGLALLPEGSKARIYIPSGYAYGTRAVNDIPANSVLIFEVRLIDVVNTAAELQQLGVDTVAIDAHLTNLSINAIKDKTGLRYVIKQTGTGAKPGLYDKVKILYTGKILSSGTVFYAGTGQPSATFDSRVINYIYAFQACLTKLPVGSKATLYVPSGLGFGNKAATGTGITVPANSNLEFDMELVEIIE